VEEIGRDIASGNVILRINPEAYGVASNRQQGDPSKILKVIGWRSRLPFPVWVPLHATQYRY